MGETDARTAIFIVSGTQGAGKSTVSALLARRFARGVHLSADVLQRLIVSGGVWPQPPAPSGEAARQLRLRLHHGCLLARTFHEAGFTAVIDDLIPGDRLAHVREELTGVPFYFVMLVPGAASVVAREHGRGSALYQRWPGLDAAIRATEHIGLWLDTSSQTPEETVDEIMRRAWDEALVPA